MEFLRYSQTPSGSKRIQHLLSSGDDNHNVDLIEMGSPISCQLVQKLLSCLDPAMRDQLATTISKQFKEVLEWVQRRALKMVSNLRGRTYEARLEEVYMTST